MKNNAAVHAVASAHGGAVFSTKAVDVNATSAEFSNNAVSASGAGAAAHGGAIYATNAATLTGTEQLILSANSADAVGTASKAASAYGGAIFNNSGNGKNIVLSGKTVELSDNIASADYGSAWGGALATSNATNKQTREVSVTATEKLTLSNNAAFARSATTAVEAAGGAVRSGATIVLKAENGAIDVSGNAARAVSTASGAASALGGALYAHAETGTITLTAQNYTISDNSAQAISSTGSATARGGAVYAPVSLTLSGQSIELNGNSADAQGAPGTAQGGAIWAKAAIMLEAGSITASGNSAKSAHSTAQGGTLYSETSISLTADELDYSDSFVVASGDNSLAQGGALYVKGDVTLTGIETLVLSGNSADAKGDEAKSQGGAVYAGSDVIVINGGAITMSGNKAHVAGEWAQAYGGALYAAIEPITITAGDELLLSGNETFAQGDYAHSYGGAVHTEGEQVTLTGNRITFSDNRSRAVGEGGEAFGGAVYSKSDFVVDDTATVEMTNNAVFVEGISGMARGGAVYAWGDTIELSAQTVTIQNNSADVVDTDSGGTASGGALNADSGTIVINAETKIDISGNQVRVTGGTDPYAFGGAVFAGNDSVTFESRGTIVLKNNKVTAQGSDGFAQGGVIYTEFDPIMLSSTGPMSFESNIVSADGDGSVAYGGAVYAGDSVELRSDSELNISGNYAYVSGDSVQALGGTIYTEGEINLTAASIKVTDNYVHATGSNVRAWGGAFASIGAITLEAADSILFSGNYAYADSAVGARGGAVYAMGDVVMTASSLNFATATDDVFSKESSITLTGALTAAPGTAFTAGGQFAMGADNTSSLMLTAQPFTDVAAERKPGDLTIFGGAADTANGAENAINFNRAPLTVYSTGMYARDGRAYMDVATVLYRNDPQLITSGNSADITEETWAPDVSAYRGGKLYIHSAVTKTDEQTSAIQDALKLGYTAKLVLAYDRRALIWRAQDAPWNEAVAANTAWVQGSDDIFTPYVEDNSYVADSFWRGDVVVFDGKVYDELTPGAEKPASGVVEVPIDAAGVAPAQVYVTGGQNHFTGGPLSAGKLFVRGSITSADFAGTVNAADLVSVDQAEVSFAELAAQVSTPVEIGGTVTVKNAANGVYTVSEGGNLTLAGGTGTLTGLTLNSGAALNVNTLSSYSVSDSFIAADGSSTVFDFGGDWTPEDGFGIGGSGTAEAAVKGAAVLTINGIAEGTTGSWKLLDKFESVAVDSTAWSYTYGRTDNTLKINTSDGTARGDLADYVVTAKAADGAYVLTITRPEGDLIWNGEKETWSASGAGRAWLIAESGDPDAPFEYEGRTFADEFADGKSVTFNKVGAVQQNVTVSGDVVTPALRVTAGAYSFAGSGAIEAHSLLIDDSIFGAGTSVSFDVPVSVSESLESGAGTTAWLTELNMGEATAANVSGQLELANAAGGVFTVTDGGTLTLAGGTGTLTGLTLNSGAALNVNTLSSYSVTDSFSALGGSVTYFGFDSWAPDDNSAWAIGGGSSAVLSSGAKLTIAGITPGDTGKWTLLSGFKNITADGWTADDITITDYDLSDYTVKAYIDGADYVLEISREKPEPPTPPDGDLIWNGTGSDTWSVSTAKPWLIASSADLDKPYEEGGSTYPSAFADGKTVTFNAIGKAQQNVTVNGDVSAGQVRVTAGEYKFGGDGKITAKELLTAGSGTTAVFDTPLSVKEKLDIGADTKAKLADLSMELNAPAAVAGRLELAKAAGGVFTVNKGGELTLAGGEGSLTGLTVENGATLNVNTLSSYSVTDSFSALGGSVTYFSFDSWRADDSSAWGISGGGTAEADLGSGAKLTVSGIKLGAGKWTLLSGFKSITAGGWSKDDITFADYDDLSGYTVAAYDDGAGNYVLEITKEEPVPPASGDPGHTEAFHIASSAQSSVSAAAEKAALGLLSVEPTVEKALWAHVWRDTGRVYDADSALSQKNRAYGIVIGRDLSRNEKSTWGMAAHIGKGDTSGKGAWDGSTSNTDFAGVLLYGRHETGRWLLTGDAGMSWYRTDYNEAGGAKADNARSTMFSLGGRAYYKWVENNAPGKMNVSPFVGLRWNRYRQSAYDYDSGDRSAAYTADQLLVPMGVKFSWGESVSKKGWRTAPSFELSYIRAFGDRSAKTGIAAKGRKNALADTPLSDRDTFSAQVRYGARRNNFQWDLNVGVRRSSSETDHAVSATFRWDL
ncbi:MAG: hypothetical protein J5974_04985 [Pyramidobacter sp.]|nr:hypothetical protein [Pyramidobacter sp.]